MGNLPEHIHDEIKRLCACGDEHVERQAFSKAIESYQAAWQLLPEPKTNWEAAKWILVAIGDANFLNRDFGAGCECLKEAMHCPDAIGNPFIHLRLGQCQFEVGNLDRAADELMRAYMGGGKDIFEQDDSKYLQFLASRAQNIR